MSQIKEFNGFVVGQLYMARETYEPEFTQYKNYRVVRLYTSIPGHTHTYVTFQGNNTEFVLSKKLLSKLFGTHGDYCHVTPVEIKDVVLSNNQKTAEELVGIRRLGHDVQYLRIKEALIAAEARGMRKAADECSNRITQLISVEMPLYSVAETELTYVTRKIRDAADALERGDK